MSSQIFTRSLFSIPHIDSYVIIFVIILFILIEWIGRENKYAIEKIGLSWSKYFRFAFYSFIVFLIAMYGQTVQSPFIYFQF